MLQLIVDRILYGVFNLNPVLRWAQAINFFVYDSSKIIFLLFAMVSVIGFLRTFIPQHKIKQWLSGRKGLAHLLASLFGAITPFCSCSSIPLFLSFIKSGIPLGVTFSFLITSPLVNEYLVVLMLGFFGWKITVAYITSGLLIGIFSGMVLGKMQLDSWIEKDIAQASCECSENVKYTLKSRIMFGLREAKAIVAKLWLWILIGVGIGALIHNYVPAEAIQGIIAKAGFFSVPIATIIGVPMYANCAAIIPVAVVLFQKGVPLGTALSFMMAVAALSLPEAVMLRRAMKLKLIAIFFGITTIAIMIIGYLFNFLQHLLI